MTKHKLAKGLIALYLSKMGYKAWTSYWNTIYYAREEDMTDCKLTKHEMKHIEQIEREGRLKFAIKYLWYAVTVGYVNNPYEVEARKSEI